MIKKSIDDRLFDPEPANTAEDRAVLAELRNLSSREITTLQSVRQLRPELEKLTKVNVLSDGVRDVLEDLREELLEIPADLRFAGKPEGSLRALSATTGDKNSTGLSGSNRGLPMCMWELMLPAKRYSSLETFRTTLRFAICKQ